MSIETELSSRQQGWRGYARNQGLTSIRQEIQDIALLPTQRNNHGQDTLDKTAPVSLWLPKLRLRQRTPRRKAARRHC